MNVENEIINKIRINKENYHFVNKELKKKILSFGMTLSIIFTSIGVNYFYNKPKEKEKEYSINMSVYDVSERKERRYIYVSDQLQEGIYAVIDGEKYFLYDYESAKLKDIPIDNLLYDVNEKYGISSTDIQQIIREEIIGVDEKYNYQEYIDYLSFYFGLFLVLSLHETFKHYINDQFVIEEILNLLVEKYKFKKEYISDFKKLILFINVGDIGEVYENNKDLFDVSPLGINLILKK